MGFHIISVWTGTGIIVRPDNQYTIRTHFIGHSHSNILITRTDAQTCMARYVPGHSNPRWCPETLAIAWSRIFSKVENPTMKPVVGNSQFTH